MPASLPSRRIVVAGGGPAALETALALRVLAPEGPAVTLLAPGRHLILRTLDDGRPRALRVALPAIAAQAGFEHVRDAVAGVDLAGRRLHTQEGAELAYDALVLAVGARAVNAIPGALTYRDARDVVRLHDALARVAAVRRSPRVVFAVPPGTTRARPLYELALHTAARLAEHGIVAELSLVTPEPEPLRSATGAPELLAALARYDVELRPRLIAEFVEDGRLWPGGLHADLVVALPHRAGPGLPGVPADTAGFALVDADGAIEGAEAAYAIGAMATREPGPGGSAAQATDVARRLAGAPPGAPPVSAWPELGRYLREHGEDGAPLS